MLAANTPTRALTYFPLPEEEAVGTVKALQDLDERTKCNTEADSGRSHDPRA